MSNISLEILGGRYQFDPNKDQILKRGLLDPYTLSKSSAEWVVLDEYIFWSARLQAPIIVPRWFITDLASIPRIFRSFISVNERHKLASLPHDFGYTIADKTRKDRSEWDGVLLDFCGQQGVGWFKKYAIYYAVRAGGWIPYKKNHTNMLIPIEHRIWYCDNFKDLNLDLSDGEYFII